MKKKFLPLLAVLIFIGASTLADDTNDYNHIGNTRFAKGDLDGAQADFTKAIEVKPDDTDAYINRGVVKLAGFCKTG
jgi:tetratricopeptide (TPR) repeat protein